MIEERNEMERMHSQYNKGIDAKKQELLERQREIRNQHREKMRKLRNTGKVENEGLFYDIGKNNHFLDRKASPIRHEKPSQENLEEEKFLEEVKEEVKTIDIQKMRERAEQRKEEKKEILERQRRIKQEYRDKMKDLRQNQSHQK